LNFISVFLNMILQLGVNSISDYIVDIQTLSDDDQR